MISVSGLHKSFGSRVLFRDAGLRVGPRERVAIVGPNGSGKTTLLEMIIGLQSPDAGVIDLAPGTTFGYLPQETDDLPDRPVLDEVVSAAEASRAEDRMRALASAIEECAPGDERDRLLRDYGEVQSLFEAQGGYSVEADARRVLSGLGFRERDVVRSCREMSGGWQVRVSLGKLLLASPDLLLLDEPTNHLDLESVTWLERFLAGYPGTVLLISHDRDFMNGLASRVVELDEAKLISYTGDYEAFVRQRAERLAQAASAARNQARRVGEIEAFIERFRYKASRARLVQSRVKSLERMERVEAPAAARRAMKVSFPQPPRSGRVVVALDDVSFSYGDLKVYEHLTVAIERGEKIALVGPNGAGKTTLLKLFAGALEPVHGERRLGHNVAVGYFAQHALDALDPSNRLVEELQRSLPPSSQVRPRDLLGRFLFSGDDVDKPVRVLSGGERTRLALAKLLVSPVNLLCLDEPTNHLDVESRDVLEDALSSYAGSIVLITHDRHLIRSIANVVFEVRDGSVYRYPGDYESFLHHVSMREPERPSQVAADARPRTAPRKLAASDRAKTAQLRTAVRKVERELEDVHAEADRVSKLLEDPAFYAAGDGVAEVVEAFESAKARISELEAEWERLTEALEG